MELFKFVDKDNIIDAVEVGMDFVTVYINSKEPGKEGSIQRNFIEKYKDILPDPYYHDPERFHKGDHPRGDNWRTWQHKYACHFHFQGTPNNILVKIWDDLGPKLQEKINET